MTPTFETVLEMAKNLPVSERGRLIGELSESEAAKNGASERIKRIRSFRGKYAAILPATSEFLAEKRVEVEIEDR